MLIKPMKLLAVVAASLALTGCISLSQDPPESLLTLTSSASAPAGSGASAGPDGTSNAIAVLTPEVPAKLDVMRVPVQVSDTKIAYLQDAVWVERPARLFRRLLGETLRTRGAELVLDTDDTPTLASRYLRGTLIEMTYDAPSQSAVVRYDAVYTRGDGVTVSRRFEASESGVPAETAFVGPALNRAANEVAGEVADWVASGG
ncbi:MAG: ABC-type transport auxiliary lipoprotein family protein [Erythrobacter sp.]